MSKITYDINDLSALKCAYFLQGYLFDHNPQIRGRVNEIIRVLECHADFKNGYEELVKNAMKDGYKERYKEDEWKKVLDDV